MITKANLNDLSELKVLVNSAYRGDSSKQGWTTEANILTGVRIDDNEIIAMVTAPKSTVYKFTENNKILGCVLLIEKKSELYLGMLCVNPELQNSGIGKKILYFANEIALAAQLTKIVMTVISTRIELINWYNRHGYVESGKREPFPDSHANDVISGEKLEFIVLEKIVS